MIGLNVKILKIIAFLVINKITKHVEITGLDEAQELSLKNINTGSTITVNTNGNSCYCCFLKLCLHISKQ